MRKNLLIGALTSIVLAVVVLLAFNLHQTSKQEIISQFRVYQLLIAKQTAHQVESYFRARSQGIKMLSSFASVQYHDIKQMPADIRYFEYAKMRHVKSISVFDKNGTIISSTDKDFKGLNYSKSNFFDWAKKKENKGKIFISSLIKDAQLPASNHESAFSDSNTGLKPPFFRLFIVTPVYKDASDPRYPRPTGEFAGVLSMTIDLTELLNEQFADESKKMKFAHVWVMDSSGTLLFQSDHPEMTLRNIRQKDRSCSQCHTSFDYAENILTRKEGTVDYKLKDFPKKLASFAPMEFENASWVIIINSSYNSVTAFVDRSLRKVLILLGIVIIALVGSSTFIYRNYRLKIKAEEEAKRWKEKLALEDKIRESEERYRTIVETAHDIIWTLDTQGNFTFVNKRGEDILGYKVEDWIGKSFVPLIPPEDLPAILMLFNEALSGKPLIHEARVYDKAGRIFVFSVSTIPLYKKGEITGTRSFGRDITEQKHAEEALRKSNEFIKTVLNSINDSISIINIDDYRIAGVNRSFLKEFGLREEDVIGKTCYEVTHQRSVSCMLPDCECPIADIAKTGMFSTVEHVHRTTDGKKIYVEVSASPIRDENGKIIQVVHISRNITERKRMEERLAKINECFLSFGENALENINRLTALCGELLGATAALYNRLDEGMLCSWGQWNLPPAYKPVDKPAGHICYDVIKREGEEVFVVSDLQQSPYAQTDPNVVSYGLQTYIGKAVKFGGAYVGSLCVVFQCDVVPNEEDKRVIGIIASAIGVEEERKQAKDALRESEEKYRQLFDNLNDAAFLADVETGIILETNKQGEILLGRTRNEIIGMHQSELHPHEKVEEYRQRFAAHVGKGNMVDFNGEISRKDGSVIPVSISGANIILGGRCLIIGLFHNISERKKLEAQLLQSQKMEAIGQLAGGIAHDFNNLLTAIIGYSELLENSLGEHNPLKNEVEQIKKAGKRAATMTYQLLAFSRKQPLQPKVLDMNDLVIGSEKMLHRLIGEDIGMVTILEPKLGRVKTDPGQTEQVIINLVVNARDAMHRGGKLTVKTENVVIDEEYCKAFSYARQGRFVCLSVEDTGTGMNNETIQHIFEPFFTTKESGKGTGLGLSTVYGIVKQHEGWINVFSEPGKGSTFKVYFPAFFIEADKEQKETVSLKRLHGKGERILLVEDDNGVREFVKRALSGSDYVVFETASAEEAIQVFEREGGNFHLVLSDVVLPNMSGLHLADELLSRKPELKVMLNSGYMDQKSQWPVIRDRGFRFMQKPYDLIDLLSAIKDVLGE